MTDSLTQRGLSSSFLYFSLIPHNMFGYTVSGGPGGCRSLAFSWEYLLPGLRQLESQQTSADQGGEGQEDGDDLCDADEGCKDEAGDDGSELADAVQDAERRPSAESKTQRRIRGRRYWHKFKAAYHFG